MNTVNNYRDVLNARNMPKEQQLIFKVLSDIEYGTLNVSVDDKFYRFMGKKRGVDAQLNIKSTQLFTLLLTKGDIGLGQSYIEGDWSSPDIAALIQFGVQNKKSFEKIIKGNIVNILFYRLRHFFNRNTRRGSQKNIHAHYDLGNDFYSIWLDESMSYSSALYKEEMNLYDAQQAKYDEILDKLNLPKGSHILEIGCGWGGFIKRACDRGYSVTGITISHEQLEYAKDLIENEELDAQVKYMDYRDLKEKYDAIVSIEMFEALGKEYWDEYFKIVKSCLKPKSKAIIQSITIKEEDFETYQNTADFIQEYIFPGGMLPSRERFEACASLAGLKLLSRVDFGSSYAKTLNRWCTQFDNQIGEIYNLGFDEKFIRTWRFYLKYCEGGFLAQKICVSQFEVQND